jgi:hypothetical protein
MLASTNMWRFRATAWVVAKPCPVPAKFRAVTSMAHERTKGLRHNWSCRDDKTPAQAGSNGFPRNCPVSTDRNGMYVGPGLTIQAANPSSANVSTFKETYCDFQGTYCDVLRRRER